MPTTGISGVDWSDPKDAADYMKRLGIEYSYGCYEEKDAKWCHLLGDWIEANNKAYKKSLSLYKQNCLERRYAASCYKYGTYMMKARQCAREVTKALEQFEFACSQDFLSGCSCAASILWAGHELEGLAPDRRRARQLMARACDEGDDSDACWQTSFMYLGIDPREAKRASARSAAATVNAPTPEQSAAEAAAIERDRAEFAALKDTPRALEYALKGCRLGVAACCLNAARMYAAGDGMAKDESKAKEYRQLADEMARNEAERIGPGFTGSG